MSRKTAVITRNTGERRSIKVEEICSGYGSSLTTGDACGGGDVATVGVVVSDGGGGGVVETAVPHITQTDCPDGTTASQFGHRLFNSSFAPLSTGGI